MSDKTSKQPAANASLIPAGAFLAASAVMLGAFAAHALAGRLSPQQAQWWQTAVQYQMWHALAVLLVAALPVRRSAIIGRLFAGGTLIFSGTLYAMALGAPHWLGAITPLGGLALIAGWLLLAGDAIRDTPRG